jgi:predicted esterase
MFTLLLLAACSAPSGDDSGKADDTGTVDEDGPKSAPLAARSSGECPDLTVSGTSSFTSSGEARQVTIIVPENPEPGMAVNFFFHGVTDPASTDNPGGETAAGLELQGEADATNTVWIVPDAPVQDLYGMISVYLWDLSLVQDHDLVLYDDLRTCVGEGLDVDLDRLSVVGFSGGALWSTVIVANRGDTLATAVELSGGSDIEAPGFDDLFAEYVTPTSDLPVLLTSGSPEADVWPSASFVVVNFAEATDGLQAELAADGHFVVRCQDDGGHEMSRQEWNLAKDWLASAQFGEPSPYEADGLGGDDDWCAVVAAGE